MDTNEMATKVHKEHEKICLNLNPAIEQRRGKGAKRNEFRAPEFGGVARHNTRGRVWSPPNCAPQRKEKGQPCSSANDANGAKEGEVASGVQCSVSGAAAFGKKE